MGPYNEPHWFHDRRQEEGAASREEEEEMTSL